MNELDKINLKELSNHEFESINGGGYPELLGAHLYGLILSAGFGLYGYAYAMYNYYKD